MKNKKKITKVQIFNGAIFAMLCFFATFCIIISQEYHIPQKSVDRLLFNGSYNINGSDTDYPLPGNTAELNIENASDIEFNLQLKNEVPKGELINIYADKVKITILYKNRVLYSFGDENSHPAVVHSVDKCFTSFTSPGLKKDDILICKITSCYDKIEKGYIEKFFENFSAGSYYNLLKIELEKNSWLIIGSALTFIIGFFLLIMTLTLRLMKTPFNIGSLSCCIFIMCGSLALFFNNTAISLIFENAFLVTMARFILELFLPLFFLMYIQRFAHNVHAQNGLSLLTALWGALIISYIIFQCCGVLDYYQFSAIIINVIIIIVFTAFLLITVDYKKNSSHEGRTLLNASIILCLCMTAELIYKIIEGEFALIIFELGLILFASLQFLVIMIFSRRNYLQASKTQEIENELVQSKISVMLSQIQPHFLYNTLVVIRQLCDINPKAAKEAVTEFASYLRGNLDSLTLNSTIPFEKEMEHVENYVSLEKKRFGDKINIEYDIEAVDFNVPSLTLQTVVENAVRHGISKRKNGGTVTIKTRENNEFYLVEIVDNGVGFDLTTPPSQQDSTRSHIGIENSRKRIEAMCGGTLNFSSTPNIGTIVTITIPRAREE